ncbi:MAG: hypothetical protein BIFFINMI_01458 [Phycisphaerae bacterium]|nr:hypothetical protein [Phycisphaerae bacterium]
MVEQYKLQDIAWICSNSVVACQAVFPCFNQAGEIKMVLVASRQWGWLAAPSDHLRFQGMELVYEGRLEDLYKLSPKALPRLADLFFFDPWRLVDTDAFKLDGELGDGVRSCNLAAASYHGQAVQDVVFDDPIDFVERVDVGTALWRRTLSGPAMSEWLQSGPMTAGASGSTGSDRVSPGDLYEATDGPLKIVARARRPGGGRVTIGVPTEEEGAPEWTPPSVAAVAPVGESAGYVPPLTQTRVSRNDPAAGGADLDLSQVLNDEPVEASRAPQRPTVQRVEPVAPPPPQRIERPRPPQRQIKPQRKKPAVPPRRPPLRETPPVRPSAPAVQESAPVPPPPPPPPQQQGTPDAVSDALERIRQRIQSSRRK